MKQLVALGMMAVIACGGSSKPPAGQPTLANKPAEDAPPPAEPTPPPADARVPTDAEVEAVMRQAMAMFIAVGDAVDAAGSDCGKLAAGIDATIDANREFVAVSRTWKDNPAMDQKIEVWMQAHMDDVMPHVMKVSNAGQTCAGQPAFDAAMKRLTDL
ncbi:MAG: hypothetical protein JNK64_25005 [Myxococcales bacterium]|nr:hypothetical protein [Myxococcales bacterium]